MKTLSALFFVTVLGASPLAFGQAQEREGDPGLITQYGMAAYVGGGVGGFIDGDMRDFAGTEGTWEARFQFGSRVPLGFELAYLGGMQSITNTLGIDKDALLLSTGAEATLRYSLLTGPISPYVFAGAGWTRFDLTNYDVNTSSVEDHDNVLAIPVGIGAAYRYGRLLADLRGTYRPSFNEDLVPKANSNDHLDLDSWAVTLHGGFEF